MKTYGEEVWERKIKEQGDIGVVHGNNSSLKKINKQTKEMMDYLDKEFLPLIQGKETLDAGIGPMARYAIEFSKRGYKVTGVDISKTTLELASAKTNVELIWDDIIELKSVIKQYDLIYCLSTFEHILKYLALDCLRAFSSKLKEKGHLILQLASEKEPGAYDIIYWSLYNIKKMFNVTNFVNISRYREDEIVDMAERVGFKIIKRGDYGLYLLQK